VSHQTLQPAPNQIWISNYIIEYNKLIPKQNLHLPLLESRCRQRAKELSSRQYPISGRRKEKEKDYMEGTTGDVAR
jgi:hypothetical protein